MTTSSKSITQLLLDWRDGDETARDKLFPLVYTEMRRLAHSYMRRERPGHTLQTSALVNEAYIRLVDHRGIRWQNRAHFYAVAAQAMRRILVDRARHHLAARHGGSVYKVNFDEAAHVTIQRASEFVALDEALVALAAIDSRKGQIVEMRYFVGLSVEETADALGLSTATVNREWRAAKLWLKRELCLGTAD
jgi:RNA polymerase sigma factor (TIGR02999 family)